MDKELIMCIVMYVIIFLWIIICPFLVNSKEDVEREEMKNKYYKAENGKKVPITDKDRWEMARPLFVDLILLVVDFVLQKDESYKEKKDESKTE